MNDEQAAKPRPSRSLHADVRRRRGPALTTMTLLQENVPAPGEDPTVFYQGLARLAAICMPERDTTALEQRLFQLLAVAGLQNSPDDDSFARETSEIFDGRPGLDSAEFHVPDEALGPYAGSPPDPYAGQRRQFARAAMALLHMVADQQDLEAATELLTWAVQLPPVPRELFLRRERAGRSRAEIAEEAQVSVSTIGSWETGTAIPGRRDWEALEKAYGFSAGEFARHLDLTGPPERRGTPAADSRRPTEADADTPLQRPPGCDCDLQARRATTEAPRLSAVPVWHDETTRPGTGSGMWFLDRDQDASAALTPRRTRSSPTSAASGTDGVLGPISLAALMHRGDWPQYLIDMSAAITRYATPHVAQRPRNGSLPQEVLVEILDLGTDIAAAYRHAGKLHPRDEDASRRHWAGVDHAVADALSKVMIATAL